MAGQFVVIALEPVLPQPAMPALPVSGIAADPIGVYNLCPKNTRAVGVFGAVEPVDLGLTLNTATSSLGYLDAGHT